MADVRLISRSLIKPSTQSELTPSRIELTPSDLQLLLVDHIQKGILFHKPELEQIQKLHNRNVIDHLKTSLSRALEYFPPLLGRLGKIQNDDATTSFFIICNNAGAEFVHAVADGVTVADVIEPVYLPRVIRLFFPMNGVLNFEGVSKPLIAVQVTELIDGIFIGITGNHSVIDGTSFWHLFNSWSEIARGESQISQLPVFDRRFFDGLDLPVRIPSWHFEPVSEKRFTSALLVLQERVFHFTRRKIGELKAKANGEMGTNRISSLQVILAHLWRSIVRCRNLDGDQLVSYKVIIGTRQRMNPPLPEKYFGNAVLFGAATTTAGELVKNGVGYGAWEINKMIGQQTEEEVRKYLEDWVKSPKKPLVAGEFGNHLITGSSPRFNVYGNDFGWGRPVTVRSGAGNKYDGKLTVFEGAEEGSIDIEACLLAETLEALANDAEFLEVVTA